MRRYKNISGDSGVLTYQMGEDHILVTFRNGNTYRYTNKSAGKVHIAKMKALAQEGLGLSTYISQYVRDRYEDLF